MKYVYKERKRRERKRHKFTVRKVSCSLHHALIDLINTIVSYALFITRANVVSEVGWNRYYKENISRINIDYILNILTFPKNLRWKLELGKKNN
jgi:hypothetical protein